MQSYQHEPAATVRLSGGLHDAGAGGTLAEPPGPAAKASPPRSLADVLQQLEANALDALFGGRWDNYTNLKNLRSTCRGMRDLMDRHELRANVALRRWRPVVLPLPSPLARFSRIQRVSIIVDGDSEDLPLDAPSIREERNLPLLFGPCVSGVGAAAGAGVEELTLALTDVPCSLATWVSSTLAVGTTFTNVRKLVLFAANDMYWTDASTNFRPARTRGENVLAHAMLAAGLPQLEELWLSFMPFVVGVEAFAGKRLRSLSVTPSNHSAKCGLLSAAQVRSLTRLTQMQTLRLHCHRSGTGILDAEEPAAGGQGQQEPPQPADLSDPDDEATLAPYWEDTRHQQQQLLRNLRKLVFAAPPALQRLELLMVDIRHVNTGDEAGPVLHFDAGGRLASVAWQNPVDAQDLTFCAAVLLPVMAAKQQARLPLLQVNELDDTMAALAAHLQPRRPLGRLLQACDRVSVEELRAVVQLQPHQQRHTAGAQAGEPGSGGEAGGHAVTAVARVLRVLGPPSVVELRPGQYARPEFRLVMGNWGPSQRQAAADTQAATAAAAAAESAMPALAAAAQPAAAQQTAAATPTASPDRAGLFAASAADVLHEAGERMWRAANAAASRETRPAWAGGWTDHDVLLVGPLVSTLAEERDASVLVAWARKLLERAEAAAAAPRPGEEASADRAAAIKLRRCTVAPPGSWALLHVSSRRGAQQLAELASARAGGSLRRTAIIDTCRQHGTVTWQECANEVLQELWDGQDVGRSAGAGGAGGARPTAAPGRQEEQAAAGRPRSGAQQGAGGAPGHVEVEHRLQRVLGLWLGLSEVVMDVPA